MQPYILIYLACSGNCSSCGAFEKCDICVNKTLIKNGFCVSDCGDGYVAGSDGVCKPCQSGCKTCFSSDTTKCTECLDTYLLSNYKCDKVCPTGTYKSSNKTCNSILN